MKKTSDISEVIAPMFAITAELDAIIATLLKDDFNMSLADFKILRAIHLLGACSQLDVARLNHITEAAVSKRIKLLADNGLIEKTTSREDKRASVLSLTSDGKLLMKRLQKMVVGSIESILGDFSQSDRKETRELLVTILSMVMKHSPRKDMFMRSENSTLENLKRCKVNGN